MLSLNCLQNTWNAEHSSGNDWAITNKSRGAYAQDGNRAEENQWRKQKKGSGIFPSHGRMLEKISENLLDYETKNKEYNEC